MQLQAFRIWGRAAPMAAPGCYGYATVCIKLYSYKCDMYATFVCQRATACAHCPHAPAVHLHAGCRRPLSRTRRAPGPAGPPAAAPREGRGSLPLFSPFRQLSRLRELHGARRPVGPRTAPRAVAPALGEKNDRSSNRSQLEQTCTVQAHCAFSLASSPKASMNVKTCTCALN